MSILFSSASTWNNCCSYRQQVPQKLRKILPIKNDGTPPPPFPKKYIYFNKSELKHLNWPIKPSLWESNRSSGTQQTLRILWHPVVHRRLQKAQKLVPVLSQMNPVPLPKLYNSVMTLSVFLCPATFHKQFHPVVFSNKVHVLMSLTFHTCCMPMLSVYSA
jgi:hypothetical protein